MTGLGRALRAAAVACLALACEVGAEPGAGPGARMLAPGVISTPGNEFSGTMTPDGREIYFSRSVPRSYMYAIFVSRRVAGRWTRPELAPFSGHGRDFDPVLSPDGKRMVFISDRPVTPGVPHHDYDIWIVERTAGGGWSEPRNLGGPANTEKPAGERGWGQNEWFASLAADGTLYVSSDGYEPGRTQIYALRWIDGRYQKPENLGPAINGDGLENGEPIIAPDQSFLLFSGYGRKGGYGGWDIYISRHRPDGTWSEPENLGPAVNTSARDYSPRLEPDGHTLVFTSERNFATGRKTPVTWAELSAGLASLLNGNGNLYEIDLCSLKLKSFPCP